MKILVTGGTGFVGHPLVEALAADGNSVIVASRSVRPPSATATYIQLPEDTGLLPADSIEQLDAIINLAGENIGAGRWTTEQKQRIETSRINLTSMLVRSIERNANTNCSYPHILINASAVGYYGVSDTATFTEDSPNGAGFLAQVCHRWEETARQAGVFGVQTVLLRFGLVLGPGGALERMALPFRYGAGGHIGSGKQWKSWIHRDDVIAVIRKALAGGMSGPYNICSPQPVTAAEFAVTLGHVLGKKAWIKMPAFLAKLCFGEMANELLLGGQRAIPTRLLDNGFRFRFAMLRDAIYDIYGK